MHGTFVIRAAGRGSETGNRAYRLELQTTETPEDAGGPDDDQVNTSGVLRVVSEEGVHNTEANTHVQDEVTDGFPVVAGVSGVLPGPRTITADALRFRVDDEPE